MTREENRPIIVVSQKDYGLGPAVMIRIAHEVGISVETWLTPTEARQLAEHLVKAAGIEEEIANA